MSNSRSNDITTGQADSGGLWVSEDMRQMFKQSRPNVSASTWVSTMRPAVDHHTKVKLNKALNPPAHAETPASTPVIRLRRDGQRPLELNQAVLGWSASSCDYGGFYHALWAYIQPDRSVALALHRVEVRSDEQRIACALANVVYDPDDVVNFFTAYLDEPRLPLTPKLTDETEKVRKNLLCLITTAFPPSLVDDLCSRTAFQNAA